MDWMVFPIASAAHYFFGIMMFLTSLFLILLVLVQRGRGGGLAGAFGGMGGQSAFGTKAGDLFTKLTMGAATFWIVLCVAAIAFLNQQSSPLGGGGGSSPLDGGGAATTAPDTMLPDSTLDDTTLEETAPGETESDEATDSSDTAVQPGLGAAGAADDDTTDTDESADSDED